MLIGKYKLGIALFLLLELGLSFSAASQPTGAFTGSGGDIYAQFILKPANETFMRTGVVKGGGVEEFEVSGAVAGNLNGTVTADFGEPTFTDTYWHLYKYDTTSFGGYILFKNNVFRIRYKPASSMAYEYFNSTFPRSRQNFTVPSAYDGFKVEYVWLIVRVPSGKKLVLHADICDYDTVTCSSTQTVTVNGPYEWWISLKLDPPRVLEAGKKYYLEVVREAGSSGTSFLILYNYPPSSEDHGVDYKLFYNSTDDKWYEETGWMLASVLTERESHTYSVSLSGCGPYDLGDLEVNFYGKNIPSVHVRVYIDSYFFSSVNLLPIFGAQPLVDYAFTVKFTGSYSLSGGTLKITSNLYDCAQSRSTYDKNHLPPFPRPFALLGVLIDSHGHPYARWELDADNWRLEVKDQTGVYREAPVSGLETALEGGSFSYSARVRAPVSPCFGFFTYKLKVPWSYTLSVAGSTLHTEFSVFPGENASWRAYNEEFEIRGVPDSQVDIKISPIPEEWRLKSYTVPLDALNQEPEIEVHDTYILLKGVNLGPKGRYSGSIEFAFTAPNYLNQPGSELETLLDSRETYIYMKGEMPRVKVIAASPTGSKPRGTVRLEVTGPSGYTFSESRVQTGPGGVEFTLDPPTSLGTYKATATFKSEDGFRVGAATTVFRVFDVRVSLEKTVVKVSEPSQTFAAHVSDTDLIESIRVVAEGPNNLTMVKRMTKTDSEYVAKAEFRSSASIGAWTVTFKVRTTDGYVRRIPGGMFTVVDDVEPKIEYVTWSPESPTFEDYVNVTAVVFDVGSGISEVVLEYTAGGETHRESMARVGEGYIAVIPKAPAFSQVKFRVLAMDKAGNVGVSEEYTYEVGIPVVYYVLAAVLVIAAVSTVVAVLKWRRKPPPPPPLPPPPPSRKQEEKPKK